MKKVSLATNKKGATLVELLLAVAIFGLFVMAVVGGIIYGREGTMIAGQRQRADLLASECQEAVRNLRDEDYANLANGTYGLSISGGKWTLSGASDILDGFTRTVVISDGVAVDQKVISCNVAWNQNLKRTGSVSLVSYLSNWQRSGGVLTPRKRGLIVYSNATDNTPYSREYDDVNNTFGPPVALPAGGIGKNFRLEMSPTKAEALISYVDNGGTLRTMCYDDSSDLWTEDWSVNVGGTGDMQRYSLAYEATSGDALVAYTTNNSGTNEIAYRTKPGASACGSGSWSAVANYDALRTSGVVNWMMAKPDRRAGQNRVYLAWSDANSDLSASVWDGTAMGSEPTAAFETALEYDTAAQDSKSWDLAVESVTGNAMLVWSPFGTTCTANSTSTTASCIRYSRYTTSWSAAATIPTVADRGTNIDIAANPKSTSNEVVLGAVANDSSDLSLAYWSGSAWTGKANHDTSTAAISPYRKMVAASWLNAGTSTRSIITYSDAGSGRIDWVVGNAGTFTTQTDFTTAPVMNNVQAWVDMTINPNSPDSLMYVAADGVNDLHAKRLVMTSAAAFTWTNSDNPGPLEANLSANTGNPFSFGFWNIIPEYYAADYDSLSNTKVCRLLPPESGVIL